MRSSRTFAALAFAFLSLAVGVPSASAIDPYPIDGNVSLSNANFTVHYNGGGMGPCENKLTHEQATHILGMLDRARNFYAGMGWPLLASGVHVSIDDFAAGGSCAPFGNGSPFGVATPLIQWNAFIENGNIHLNSQTGLTYHIIAHEVFHLVEDSMAPNVDQWLQEGAAEWETVRADNAAGVDEKNPDRTMDCVGSRCGDTNFDQNGYPGWMLFEYLAE